MNADALWNQQETEDEERERKKRLLKRIKTDRRYYQSKFLKIKTRDSRIINLNANEAQNRLLLMVEGQEKAGKPVRGVCLKPRRVGCSTEIQAILFQRAATKPNINALTVAHDLDSTQEMFEMDGLFYDELPEDLRPLKRYSNRKELVFENPDDVSRRVYPGLRSKLRVATSSDEELGRSKEIHLLHCSEVAFWDKADTTMLSLCNAVSANTHTMIFKESTPNGVGNYFYREYKAAKAGKSDYFAYFMAWFEFHAHQKPLDGSPEAFEGTITDDEKQMREKYNLSLEQLNWRRWAIRELCGNDEEKFKQEYPSNDTECFLLSGRHFFDGKLIAKLLAGNLYEPGFRGKLIPDYSHPLRYRVDPNDKGELKIWKLPAYGRRYILGADVAEGLEHGDYSVGHVHDWETFDLCAAWHGHTASDLFGDRLAEVGHLYGDALIACEDNIGTPNKKLLRLGYPHLYYRQELDDRIKRRTQKLGWLTTHISKSVMLDCLQQLLRDGAEIPDQELVDEIATFIYFPDGRIGGESGTWDDRVIASAIAAAARQTWGINRFFPKPT